MSTPSELAQDLIDAMDRGEPRPTLRLRAAALVSLLAASSDSTATEDPDAPDLAEWTRLMRAEGLAYVPTPAVRAARLAALTDDNFDAFPGGLPAGVLLPIDVAAPKSMPGVRLAAMDAETA